MTRDIVEATVGEAFAAVVGENPPRGAETHPDHLATWDSLAHVMLMHELETRFGVALPEEMLTARVALGRIIDAVHLALAT